MSRPMLLAGRAGRLFSLTGFAETAAIGRRFTSRDTAAISLLSPGYHRTDPLPQVLLRQ